MDAIFKEFEQVNCGMTHEVKLRVLDELHTAESQHLKIEMLISGCQSECDWQEAICDSIQYASATMTNRGPSTNRD